MRSYLSNQVMRSHTVQLRCWLENQSDIFNALYSSRLLLDHTVTFREGRPKQLCSKLYYSFVRTGHKSQRSMPKDSVEDVVCMHTWISQQCAFEKYKKFVLYQTRQILLRIWECSSCVGTYPSPHYGSTDFFMPCKQTDVSFFNDTAHFLLCGLRLQRYHLPYQPWAGKWCI